MSAPRIAQFSDLEALSQAAAGVFSAAAREAVAHRGRFTVALAGGSTPRRVYELLASGAPRESVPWSQVEFFWGDERAVSPDHPESNYRMAHEALISRIEVAPAQIHRMPAERPNLEQAATDYQHELARTLGVSPNEEPPVLDLVLLGLGNDGHTASLFPHTAALGERHRWVVANYVPKLKSARLTLTASIINWARHVLFLVAGLDKADVLAAVLTGPRDPMRLPAQLIVPVNGNIEWLVDAEAARALSPLSPSPLPQGERVKKK